MNVHTKRNKGEIKAMGVVSSVMFQNLPTSYENLDALVLDRGLSLFVLLKQGKLRCPT